MGIKVKVIRHPSVIGMHNFCCHTFTEDAFLSIRGGAGFTSINPEVDGKISWWSNDAWWHPHASVTLKLLLD